MENYMIVRERLRGVVSVNTNIELVRGHELDLRLRVVGERKASNHLPIQLCMVSINTLTHGSKGQT